MKKERIGLVVAVLLIVWLSAALVVERAVRHAVGMCWNDTSEAARPACIEKAQTRTAWYWHLSTP